MQPEEPPTHGPRSSLMIRALALEAPLARTDRIDPTNVAGATLSVTVTWKW